MTPEDVLESGIRSLLEAARIPGCSLAVVDPGGVVWSREYGFADLVNRRPAERSTVYHLFSGTKLFTATAVLQLVEQGKLDLEARASDYFPDLPQLREVSLRDLLSHRSGLRDTRRGFLAVEFPGGGLRTTREALSGYEVRRSAALGGRVRYRNVNYAILGEVVSRVSGLEYRDYVRERILAPLSSDADFDVSGYDEARRAVGHVRRFDPTRLLIHLFLPSVTRRLYRGRAGKGLVGIRDYNLGSSSIGGLVGSVDSFAPFLRAQLAGGAPLLSERTTRLMQTLAARGRAGVASRTGVGLGWKVGAAGGRRFLNHEGCGPGFTSELRLYPDDALGIVVLMNLSSIARTMRLAHEVCELIRESRGALPAEDADPGPARPTRHDGNRAVPTSGPPVGS